jgi:NADPH-dependent glutamate synthase beta subunit-like oxidoreductase
MADLAARRQLIPIPVTDVSDPRYYHKVVDCQWACPAHTDVPQYIRLIGQGLYAEAYLLNRSSNVFPGILGRTCDRPCEPACRRSRVDGKPVAICRLKRVASDLRGEVGWGLPRAAESKNGKRVACVGAGPASLTVANDLMPLGYDVTVFEKQELPGGLMRTNIPAFRLPAKVLDEEVKVILDLGVDIRYGTEIGGLRELLKEGYDAVFVGSGAPRGKELELPGRHDEVGESHIHIGIDWLESIAFGHVTEVGRRVLIIGVGNTAMDCCRSSRRLGGQEIKVMARRPRQYFKASPWELEDAEEEGVGIVVNCAPRRFLIEDGRLVGMEFDRVEWDQGAVHSTVLETTRVECDDVILAIGQENAFPWIERDLNLEFSAPQLAKVDPLTMESTVPGVFFGGDAAFGAKNIIWAVEHGHQAAISIHNHCQGIPVTDRPTEAMTLTSRKMGITQWSYHNDYNPSGRQEVARVELTRRFEGLNLEVELGFGPEETAREVQRCLNCDVQTHFQAPLCIECDACIDICPARCLSIVPADWSTDEELRDRLNAPASNLEQAIFVSDALPQTGRVMVKDENLCVHCGLCAERCPTAAWDMAKSELFIPYAGRPVEVR